jgi:hypothetical protein
MTRLPIARRAAGLGLTAAAVAVFGLVPPASAAPRSASETWFLAAPGSGAHVGTRYVNCSNPFIVVEGTVTPYRWVVWTGPC